MTTIAWDGKTLAVDSQMTTGNVRSLTHKIHRLPSGDAVTGSGILAEILEAVDWLMGGEEGPPPNLEEATVIRLNRDGKCWVYIGRMKAIPAQAVDAWGSGSDFAISALTMGKTAKEAVIFASHFDVYTNDKVDTITFSQRVSARKSANKK